MAKIPPPESSALTEEAQQQQEEASRQQLSEEGSKQLLELLIRRGYFHSNNIHDQTKTSNATTNIVETKEDEMMSSSGHIIRQLDPTTITTVEEFQEWQEQQPSNVYYSANSTTHCSIIPNLSGSIYYSPKGLAQVIFQILVLAEDENNNDGTSVLLSLSDVASKVSISKQYLQDELSLTRLALIDLGIQFIQQHHHHHHLHQKMEEEVLVVKSTYWKSLQNQIQHDIQEKGIIYITDLIHRYDWSLEVIMTNLIQPYAMPTSAAINVMNSPTNTTAPTTTSMTPIGWHVISQGGGQALVSTTYLKQLHDTVIKTFRALQEPILVSKVCTNEGRGWDPELVIEWLLRIAATDSGSTTDSGGGGSGGELHIDTNQNHQTSMFTPHVYTQNQRQSLQDFFAVNGYVTAETARRYGVLPYQMINWIMAGTNNGDDEEEEQDHQKNASSPSNIVLLGGDATVSGGEDSSGKSKDYGNDVVLLADHILENVEMAIQECCNSSNSGAGNVNSTSTTTTTATTTTSNDVIDLQEYLPIDLLSQPETVRLILQRIGFGTTTTDNENKYDKGGVAVITSGEAMIVSTRMVLEIQKNVLPPLIQTFAKIQAEKLNTEALNGTSTTMEGSGPITSGGKKGAKGKRKGKKGKISQDTSNSTVSSSIQTSSQQPSTTAAASSAVVPLLQVAGAILKTFPDFMPEGTEEQLLEQAEYLTWEQEEDDGSSNTDDDLLLVQFCKRALYTDQFQTQCRQAICAEWNRLQSVRQSKSSLSRKDAAAKVRSVEGSFEEAFVTACYMIQTMMKFRTLAMSQTEYFTPDALAVLDQELLQGCCADLTSRVTQYCLFQNEEEGGIFSFDHPDNCSSPTSGGSDGKNDNDGNDLEDTPMTGLPAYCQSLDTAVRHYPKTYLSCPPPREPLPLLRESLSGTVGVSLARQWILCGGECYQGGVKPRTDDGDDDDKDGSTPFIRPGNLEAFLKHVEENCLTVCGLPFKKLDKKSEKQFLFDRRQRLTQFLQSMSVDDDPEGVLDVTIMILVQQVKQVVVVLGGSHLRGPILNWLIHERKIPKAVATVLQTLADAIGTETTTTTPTPVIDFSLVATVKECGLCRDISKLQLEGY